MYTDAPPTQGVALSLVRAAHSLSCDIVHRLARRRLCAIWDAEHPPKASPRPGTKMSPTPSSLLADTATVHTYHDAVFIILKRASTTSRNSSSAHSMNSSPAPSSGPHSPHTAKQIKLTESDLLRLYNARHLQRRWRETVVLAPYMNAQGVSPCRGDGSACSICLNSIRSQHWRRMMLKSEVVEAGMGDPLRYDALSGLTKEQKEAWCRVCRKGWTDVLVGKRREWWASIGGLMQLA